MILEFKCRFISQYERNSYLKSRDIYNIFSLFDDIIDIDIKKIVCSFIPDLLWAMILGEPLATPVISQAVEEKQKPKPIENDAPKGVLTQFHR